MKANFHLLYISEFVDHIFVIKLIFAQTAIEKSIKEIQFYCAPRSHFFTTYKKCCDLS